MRLTSRHTAFSYFAVVGVEHKTIAAEMIEIKNRHTGETSLRKVDEFGD